MYFGVNTCACNDTAKSEMIRTQQIVQRRIGNHYNYSNTNVLR